MIKMLPVSLLDWLIFSIVLLLVLLVLLNLLRRLWRGKPKQPYQQKLLFSPEGATALRLLDEAIGKQLRIFAAVNISELIALSPKLKKSHREQAWHAIYGETLDFVLCSPKDLKPRAAVVLADDSLSRSDGKKQQQLLQQIQDAGLPVIQLSPKAWPDARELQDDIIAACKPVAAAMRPSSGQGRVEPVLNLPDEEQTGEQDNEPRIKL